MPVHDYKCKCGERLNNYFSFLSEIDQPVLCPKCNAVMEKILAAPNFKIHGGTPKFHKRG